MRRFFPLLIAGVALIATACGDVIAPTRSNPTTDFVRVGAPLSAARDAHVPDFATRQEITIPAAGGVVNVGGFTLYFSRNSVCDPGTSGYGAETWDNSCETLATDYSLTAAFWEENGQAFVEFLDDIRFSPDRWVVLSVKPPAGVTDILYFRRNLLGGMETTNEGLSDSSMQTFYNSWSGEVFRRIKHFSGYMVASGRECDPNTEECPPPGGE